jgi:hypothetical protein
MLPTSLTNFNNSSRPYTILRAAYIPESDCFMTRIQTSTGQETVSLFTPPELDPLGRVLYELTT